MSLYRWQLSRGITISFWPHFALAVFREAGRWRAAAWRFPKNTHVPTRDALVKAADHSSDAQEMKEKST